MMNDAIALLAISQLVCLAGIAYLYSQVQALRSGSRRQRRAPSPRLHAMDEAVNLAAQQSTQQAARMAYGAHPQAPRRQTAAQLLAARVGDVDIDIPALARRMRRSEEEVRLLLRRQGAIH
jgi:hypothetical protein